MTISVDILPYHLTIVRDVVKTALPKEAKIYVFGSRVTGRARKASDLDLAIDAGRPLTPSERAVLTDGFDVSNLPYRVDIVDLQDVSDSFKAIIDSHKVSLP